jgi:hypothetical protein
VAAGEFTHGRRGLQQVADRVGRTASPARRRQHLRRFHIDEESIDGIRLEHVGDGGVAVTPDLLGEVL